MYCTGFADEAADTLDGQIRATKTLGWRHIEARNIDGVNIHDLPDEAFDKVCATLADAGVEINCFGSTIANWGTPITAPFEADLEKVRRAIPRMQRLGAKLIRIMSYALVQDEQGRVLDDQMEAERFRRLREITTMFTDAGITPVHENCMDYGGMGWPYSLKMLEHVPGLKLVFDTGNPVINDDFSKPKPYPKQSAWEFYTQLKDHIVYVHIKDGVFDPQVNPDDLTYTFPGEGHGDVKRIVQDLCDRGYDGGFSMEPHMAVVFHDQSVQSDADVRFENYVEYGRRFMTLLKEVGCPLSP
ncbi:TIM barrel protein [candidate division KSB3 bacterium]|uniref:TIM barrel protein n=1 Tax=candidate division KSB3 bacterium TaxID=2044937 RepID=A0A9D5JUI3_9BACT|nr:TIM barrel protein [candidate division KSB3 bacterium]MBD3324503.1 TIM barrel protein [candidate division KSB3 bacterium]